MAEEVEMTPVVGAEPPKANPIPGVASPVTSTLKLNPVHKPVVGGGAPALKPGLKLPPKPGATVSALRPGLKLPTQTALKPGLKLPAKPVIRKPGATVAAMPLPKPVVAAPAAAPAAVAPAAAPVAKSPIAVDAQGIGKLPTVSAPSVSRGDTAPVVPEMPKPMEALKAATQKLKGLTQEIPQQAILHKTGIISDGVASEAQKEAAKHKTARISLSDAMGVAPVKDAAAPMKTIRIRRPIDIASSSEASKSAAAPAASAAVAPAAPAAPESAEASAPTMTQRKTLKISRPGGTAVRPTGKFGVKRPTAAAPAAEAADADVPEIADIPNLPTAPIPMAAPVSEGSSWVFTLSALVQLAACGVIGVLAWFLYQNTQTAYF